MTTSGAPDEAVDFYDRHSDYDSDKERLLAIMENIVKNKGEFKP